MAVKNGFIWFLLDNGPYSILISLPFTNVSSQKDEFLIFVAILCDGIWNLRNQVQFEDRSLSFDVSKIWRTFVEFKILESLMGLLWVLVLQSRAGPPSHFAVKLIVDAVVGSKFSSIDMIARDWRWELLFSCSHKSNTVLPLQAEAEEIKMALSLVPKIEVESILIEADSKIYHEALLNLSTLLLGD